MNDEIVYLNGKEVDLSVNTRQDLIFFIRAQILNAENAKKDARDLKEILAAAAFTNGGTLRITREASERVRPDTVIERHNDTNTMTLVYHVYNPEPEKEAEHSIHCCCPTCISPPRT